MCRRSSRAAKAACRVDGTNGTLDLCPIERFDGEELTLALSLKDAAGGQPAGRHEVSFGVQTDRYAAQLLDLAAIVRGEKPNDQDYDRDLRVLPRGRRGRDGQPLHGRPRGHARGKPAGRRDRPGGWAADGQVHRDDAVPGAVISLASMAGPKTSRREPPLRKNLSVIGSTCARARRRKGADLAGLVRTSTRVRGAAVAPFVQGPADRGGA